MTVCGARVLFLHAVENVPNLRVTNASRQAVCELFKRSYAAVALEVHALELALFAFPPFHSVFGDGVHSLLELFEVLIHALLEVRSHAVDDVVNCRTRVRLSLRHQVQ